MPEPKRVAVIIYSLAMGGAEVSAINRVRAINRHGGYAELIVLTGGGQMSTPKDIPVSFVNAQPRNKWLPLWYSFMALQLKKHLQHRQHQLGRFSLVLANTHKCNLVVSKAQLEHYFTPCQVHYVVHSSLLSELRHAERKNKQKERFFLHNNKRLICVSKMIEDEIRLHTDLKPKSLTTIYNPFDIEKIQTLANIPDPDLPNQPYILHIGRFSKAKRHDLLLNAFTRLKTDHLLLCVTDKPDALQELVKRYHVETKVRVLPYREHPFSLIKHARLCVLCSDHEGFGNVICESLSLGTPVVSTNSGGPQEQLTGKLARYLVPCGNINELAKKMVLALSDFQENQRENELANAPILTQVSPSITSAQLLNLAP